MKRVLIVFLIMIFLLCGCFGADAAEGKKVILFRNIPWGTTVDVFTEMASKNNWNGRTENTKCGSFEWKSEVYKHEPCSLYVTDGDENSGYLYKASFKDDSLMVAGLPVDEVEAYFLDAYDSEKFYTEENKAGLYMAKYKFNHFLYKAEAFEYLAEKLTELYGEGTRDTASYAMWSTGGAYHENLATVEWAGADDTAVLLSHYYETLDSTGEVKAKNNYLVLCYGRYGEISQYNAAAGAIQMNELRKQNIVDGL